MANILDASGVTSADTLSPDAGGGPGTDLAPSPPSFTSAPPSYSPPSLSSGPASFGAEPSGEETRAPKMPSWAGWMPWDVADATQNQETADAWLKDQMPAIAEQGRQLALQQGDIDFSQMLAQQQQAEAAAKQTASSPGGFMDVSGISPNTPIVGAGGGVGSAATPNSSDHAAVIQQFLDGLGGLVDRIKSGAAAVPGAVGGAANALGTTLSSALPETTQDIKNAAALAPGSKPLPLAVPYGLASDLSNALGGGGNEAALANFAQQHGLTTDAQVAQAKQQFLDAAAKYGANPNDPNLQAIAEMAARQQQGILSGGAMGGEGDIAEAAGNAAKAGEAAAAGKAEAEATAAGGPSGQPPAPRPEATGQAPQEPPQPSPAVSPPGAQPESPAPQESAQATSALGQTPAAATEPGPSSTPSQNTPATPPLANAASPAFDMSHPLVQKVAEAISPDLAQKAVDVLNNSARMKQILRAPSRIASEADQAAYQIYRGSKDAALMDAVSSGSGQQTAEAVVQAAGAHNPDAELQQQLEQSVANAKADKAGGGRATKAKPVRPVAPDQDVALRAVPEMPPAAADAVVRDAARTATGLDEQLVALRAGREDARNLAAQQRAEALRQQLGQQQVQPEAAALRQDLQDQASARMAANGQFEPPGPPPPGNPNFEVAGLKQKPIAEPYPAPQGIDYSHLLPRYERTPEPAGIHAGGSGSVTGAPGEPPVGNPNFEVAGLKEKPPLGSGIAGAPPPLGIDYGRLGSEPGPSQSLASSVLAQYARQSIPSLLTGSAAAGTVWTQDQDDALWRRALLTAVAFGAGAGVPYALLGGPRSEMGARFFQSYANNLLGPNVVAAKGMTDVGSLLTDGGFNAVRSMLRGNGLKPAAAEAMAYYRAIFSGDAWREGLQAAADQLNLMKPAVGKTGKVVGEAGLGETASTVNLRAINAIMKFWEPIMARAEQMGMNAAGVESAGAAKGIETKLSPAIGESPITETAMTRAHSGMLMGEPEGVVGRVLQPLFQAIQKAGSLGRFVEPFANIPANLIDRAVSSTPIVGGLNAIGAKAPDAVIARTVMGTTAALLLKGMFQTTGAGPSDPAQKTAWLKAGNEPYSVKLPWSNTWVPINKIPMPLLRGALMFDASMNDVKQNAAPPEKAMQFAKSYVNAILDDIFVPELIQMGLAFQKGDLSSLPADVAGVVRSLLPQGFRLMAKAEQTVKPDVSGKPYRPANANVAQKVGAAAKAEVLANTPRGVGLPSPAPALTNAGTTQPNEQTGASVLSPLAPSQPAPDKVTDAFNSVGVPIPNAPTFLTINDRHVDLNGAQTQRFNVVRGQYLATHVGPGMTATQAASLLDRARAAAEEDFRRNNHDAIQQAPKTTDVKKQAQQTKAAAWGSWGSGQSTPAGQPAVSAPPIPAPPGSKPTPAAGWGTWGK